jgi:hypothetical protein
MASRLSMPVLPKGRRGRYVGEHVILSGRGRLGDGRGVDVGVDGRVS